MTKRENPRRREREFNKFQEKSNRYQEKNNRFQDRREEKRDRNYAAGTREANSEAVREDLVIGRNAVIEALKSDRTIECLYVSKGDLEWSIKVALGLAKDKGVVVKEADRRKLDTMCEGLNHQGIVAKVTNINATIDILKEQGIWIYGADIDGTDYSYNTDFSGPCALIIGSEGKGISNLTLKKCDLLVKIPMIGKINSLNASVAGGIMMYEVLKGRLTK